jgi:uncharacterized DUF497 family protein
MVRAVAGFDWDIGNLAKCRKHGVSIEEIEFLFESGPRIAPDVNHSFKEDRFIAVGRGSAGRALFVAFMFRKVDGTFRIRPISARYMHRKEIDAHEEESAETKDRRGS